MTLCEYSSVRKLEEDERLLEEKELVTQSAL
jgi:hypothetical protein